MDAAVLAETSQMPKKRVGRPKSSQRKDSTAKIDSALLAKAKYVADMFDISVAEYLTEALRATVERDFVKAQKLGTTEIKD